MIRFLTRRLLGMLPVLFCVALVSFGIVSLFPGDYYTSSIVQFALSGMSRSEAFQAREALRAAAGVDRSWIAQFFVWFGGFLRTGDMGVPWDYLFHRSNGLGWTFVIVLSSALWAWIFGVPLGILSAVRRMTWIDHLITVGTYAAFAFPQYVWGWVLFWFVYSFIDSNISGPGIWGFVTYELRGAPLTWGKVASHILHLIPAWVIVGTPLFAAVVRQLRMGLLDTWHEHYLLTARGKGVSEARIILKHALRNALNPLISTLGIMLPTLVVGSILVAPVLGMNTFGRVFLDALKTQNQRVLTAALLIYSLFLLVANLFTDLLLVWIDPRIRYD